jgi:hypothetical protein
VSVAADGQAAAATDIERHPFGSGYTFLCAFLVVTFF